MDLAVSAHVLRPYAAATRFAAALGTTRTARVTASRTGPPAGRGTGPTRAEEGLEARELQARVSAPFAWLRHWRPRPFSMPASDHGECFVARKAGVPRVSQSDTRPNLFSPASPRASRTSLARAMVMFTRYHCAGLRAVRLSRP